MVPKSLPELPKPSRTPERSQKPMVQNPNVYRKIIYFELYPHPERQRHAYLTSIVDIYSLHSYLTFLSDISICNCPPRSAVGQLSLEATMKTKPIYVASFTDKKNNGNATARQKPLKIFRTDKKQWENQKTRERIAASEQYWRLPSSPIVEKNVHFLM